MGLKGESSYSGHTTQARTSFMPHEILWGYRFLNIVTYDKKIQSFVADTDLIDEVERVDMPQYSAEMYKSIMKIQ